VVDDDDKFKLACGTRIFFFFRFIVDIELVSVFVSFCFRFVDNVVWYSLGGNGDDGRFRPRRLNRCLLVSLFDCFESV
jgi:hypothetical protein